MAFSVNNNTSNVTIQVTQPYLVVDDEGLKAFAVGVQGPPTGATTNLGGLTDVDNAAVPTNRFIVIGDGAKFVTRGIEGDDLPTIPLSKLVNLTSAQLSATAGILSNQIAGLDASKITGTFPLSLMNQGTTAQFLRGDGTYSNTLTGGLTLGSNLTMPASGVITTNTSLASDTGFVGIYGGGAAIASRGGRVLACGLNNVSYPGGVVLATADASGSVSAVVQGITRGDFTTSGLAVTGAIAASGAVSGTTGTFSGDVSTAVLVSTAGRFYAPAFANGSLIMRQGSGASQNQISFQNSAGTNRGTIIAANSMFIDYDEHVFRALNTTTRATINSLGFTLGAPNKIIYGNAGTTTAANNEIVGTATGPVTNAPSGSTVRTAIAGTTVTTTSNTGLAVTGAMAASGAVSGTTGTFSSDLTTTGTLLVTRSAAANSLMIMRTGSGAVYNNIDFQTSSAVSQGYFQAVSGAMYYGFDQHIFRSWPAGVVQANISSTGVTLSAACKIIYGAAGATNAANNEIVGAVGGFRYNVASGLSHTFLIGGSALMVLSAAGLAVAGSSGTTTNIALGAAGISGTSGHLLNARDDGRTIIGGGSQPSEATGSLIELRGSAAAANPGRLLLTCGTNGAAFTGILDRVGTTQVRIDESGTTIAKIILTANTPATATSTGTAGQIAWDASGNIYICSATNTWRRVATSTF